MDKLASVLTRLLLKMSAVLAEGLAIEGVSSVEIDAAVSKGVGDLSFSNSTDHRDDLADRGCTQREVSVKVSSGKKENDVQR